MAKIELNRAKLNTAKLNRAEPNTIKLEETKPTVEDLQKKADEVAKEYNALLELPDEEFLSKDNNAKLKECHQQMLALVREILKGV